MDDKGFWSGFVETGDPVFYLLAKRMEEQTRRDEAGRPKRQYAADGDLPRPSD